MINREILEAQGYRKYQNPTRRDSWDEWVYQKRFRDSKGVRYFIDVQEYDWSIFPEIPRSVRDRYSYTAMVQFYDEEENSLLRVSVQKEAAYTSVDTLETFVENIWTNLGAGYYELD